MLIRVGCFSKKKKKRRASGHAGVETAEHGNQSLLFLDGKPASARREARPVTAVSTWSGKTWGRQGQEDVGRCWTRSLRSRASIGACYVTRTPRPMPPAGGVVDGNRCPVRHSAITPSRIFLSHWNLGQRVDVNNKQKCPNIGDFFLCVNRWSPGFANGLPPLPGNRPLPSHQI
jgi:hypothetical protein